MTNRFVAAIGAAILVLAMTVAYLAGESASRTELPEYSIDATDEKLMHELGLPTKHDVEMWRSVHRWGYSTENVMWTEHVYTELPGRNPKAWYELYGIEE